MIPIIRREGPVNSEEVSTYLSNISRKLDSLENWAEMKESENSHNRRVTFDMANLIFGSGINFTKMSLFTNTLVSQAMFRSLSSYLNVRIPNIKSVSILPFDCDGDCLDINSNVLTIKPNYKVNLLMAMKDDLKIIPKDMVISVTSGEGGARVSDNNIYNVVDDSPENLYIRTVEIPEVPDLQDEVSFEVEIRLPTSVYGLVSPDFFEVVPAPIGSAYIKEVTLISTSNTEISVNMDGLSKIEKSMFVRIPTNGNNIGSIRVRIASSNHRSINGYRTWTYGITRVGAYSAKVTKPEYSFSKFIPVEAEYVLGVVPYFMSIKPERNISELVTSNGSPVVNFEVWGTDNSGNPISLLYDGSGSLYKPGISTTPGGSSQFSGLLLKGILRPSSSGLLPEIEGISLVYIAPPENDSDELLTVPYNRPKDKFTWSVTLPSNLDTYAGSIVRYFNLDSSRISEAVITRIQGSTTSGSLGTTHIDFSTNDTFPAGETMTLQVIGSTKYTSSTGTLLIRSGDILYMRVRTGAHAYANFSCNIELEVISYV